MNDPNELEVVVALRRREKGRTDKWFWRGRASNSSRQFVTIWEAVLGEKGSAEVNIHSSLAQLPNLHRLLSSECLPNYW